MPTDLGLLTDLTELNLELNSITGTVPTQLGLCEKMVTHIALASNSITGTVPTQLGNLKKMTSYVG